MITEHTILKNYCLIIHENSLKNRANEVNAVIKELSSKILKEMNIPRRSDLTFLELKYPSVNATQETFNKFFDSATVFARLYKNFVGCQVIDISDWVHETQSERFHDLLNYFRKNTVNSKFIILVPVTDNRIAMKVLAVLSTALEVSPIYLENKIEEQIMEQIVDELKRHQVALNAESQILLEEWIEQGRLNVFINQIDGVKLLVKAILSGCNISQTNYAQIHLITIQQLALFDENFLSYVNAEKNCKRKIGF